MITALLGALGSFLSSKVGPPLFLVIGAGAALGWGMWYMEDKAHDRTLVTLGEQKGETRKAVEVNEGLQKTITTMNDQRRTDEVNRAVEQEAFARMRKELDQTNAKYDSMRSRLAPAMVKKGSLIARLANRATDKLLRDLETGTCRADCSGDEADPGEATIDEPAASPEPSGLR